MSPVANQGLSQGRALLAVSGVGLPVAVPYTGIFNVFCTFAVPWGWSPGVVIRM